MIDTTTLGMAGILQLGSGPGMLPLLKGELIFASLPPLLVNIGVFIIKTVRAETRSMHGLRGMLMGFWWQHKMELRIIP
jgi:hypothetical protein